MAKQPEARSSNKNLEKQLADYAVAGNATSASASRAMLIALGAVGIGALAQPAGAEVVYTRTDIMLRGDSRFFLDLNNDGIADVSLLIDSFSASSRFVIVRGISAYRIAPGGVAVSTKGFAAAGQLGQRAGPRNHFASKGDMCFFSVNKYSGTSEYPWHDVHDRFLGVKFVIGKDIHYGWVRMSTSTECAIVKITAYAYETTPNKPIIAGWDTLGKIIPAVPEMSGSLGALAAGAVTRSRNRSATPHAK